MEKEIETMNQEWENILSMLGSNKSDIASNGYSEQPVNEISSDILSAKIDS